MLRLAATRTTAAAAACARTARPCGSVGATTATSSFFTSTPVRKDDVVLKGEIVASLAEEHDLSTAQANRIVSGLFDSIVEVRLAHRPTVHACADGVPFGRWLWVLTLQFAIIICFGSKKEARDVLDPLL